MGRRRVVSRGAGRSGRLQGASGRSPWAPVTDVAPSRASPAAPSPTWPTAAGAPAPAATPTGAGERVKGAWRQGTAVVRKAPPSGAVSGLRGLRAAAPGGAWSGSSTAVRGPSGRPGASSRATDKQVLAELVYRLGTTIKKDIIRDAFWSTNASPHETDTLLEAMFPADYATAIQIWSQAPPRTATDFVIAEEVLDGMTTAGGTGSHGGATSAAGVAMEGVARSGAGGAGAGSSISTAGGRGQAKADTAGFLAVLREEGRRLARMCRCSRPGGSHTTPCSSAACAKLRQREAELHADMHKAYRKSREAYHGLARAVAGDYAGDGKAAQKARIGAAAQASRLVFAYHNPELLAVLGACGRDGAEDEVVSIDLHGLRKVDVAPLLQEVCVDRVWARNAGGRGGAVLQLVTGRGSHSKGRAALRPAVKSFLRGADGCVVVDEDGGSVTVRVGRCSRGGDRGASGTARGRGRGGRSRR